MARSHVEVVTLARLDGRPHMKHNFYPGRNGHRLVEAASRNSRPRVKPINRRIRTLHLATRRETQSRFVFSVAVQSRERDKTQPLLFVPPWIS